jgi:hypothetical protein
MKRMVTLFLLMALLSASCHKSNDSSPTSDFDQSLAGVTDADFDVIPNLATTFGANISLIDFTTDQEAKMDKAIEIIKLVIATEEFKDRVLGYTYNGSKTFVDNGGYTNAQIYKKMLDGAEQLIPVKNNMMDAEVELYYANTNIVGYTYVSTNRIWVNTKYFNTYTAAGVAHNLFHEWLHKIGFTHAEDWSVSRDSSVPYAIGNIVGDIGNDFL